jgi:hypothetical protein
MKLYIIGYVAKINIKSFLKIKEENKIVKFIEEILLFTLFPISFLIDNLGIYFILLSFVLNVLIYLFLGIYFNKKIVSKKVRYSYYIFFIVILVINFYFFGWHFIGYRIDHCNVY